VAKEAKARILINDFLQRSGWRFVEDKDGPANIALEVNVKIKKVALDALGSWLNLTEMFFSKMIRVFLRSLRVTSKEELKQRIEKYLEEINAAPVMFEWTYKLDDAEVIV